MRKFLILCCVAALSMCTRGYAAVSADSSMSHVYVGVGGGLTYANNDYGSHYQAFAGYNFNRSWSAELGYTFAQTADASWLAQTEYTAKIYRLVGKYNIHLNHHLVWSAQLGAAYLNESASVSILNQTVTVPVISGWAPMLGTNLSYYWSRSISTGVGVTYIPSSSKLEGGIDGDVNLAVHF